MPFEQLSAKLVDTTENEETSSHATAASPQKQQPKQQQYASLWTQLQVLATSAWFVDLFQASKLYAENVQALVGKTTASHPSVLGVTQRRKVSFDIDDDSDKEDEEAGLESSGLMHIFKQALYYDQQDALVKTHQPPGAAAGEANKKAQQPHTQILYHICIEAMQNETKLKQLEVKARTLMTPAQQAVKEHARGASAASSKAKQKDKKAL
jgi:hypothetical protein